ncbi:unnamed protein product, partial [Prorocentrum cordatum]
VCAVHRNRRVKIGVDSGAGVTVWPEDLRDDYPTRDTPESRAGFEYVPAGKGSKGIVDLGERTCSLTDDDGQRMDMKVHVCDVRKPLLSMAEMNDRGLDVHFYADRSKGAFCEHSHSGSRVKIERVNDVFEIVAYVDPWTNEILRLLTALAWHCVAGRGKADQRRASETDGQIPVLRTDCGFLGEKSDVEKIESKTVPCIIVKDGPPPAGARWVGARAVQCKGVQRECSCKIVAQVIIHTGRAKFIFKSDGEGSLLAVTEAAVPEVRRAGCGISVAPEESPVGDSQNNGYIERAIWEVQSLARVLVHRAVELHKSKFHAAHPLVVWALRYSLQLLNRFQRSGDDGRAAFARRKGRPCRRRVPEFCELVIFLTVADGKHRRELDERFHAGMCVGLLDRADEVIVLTKDGDFEANAIRGLPRLGPHKTGDDDAERIVPYLAAAPVVPAEELPPPLAGKSLAGPRRVYIRRGVEVRPVAEGGFGCTDGRGGCVAAREGKPAMAHSEVWQGSGRAGDGGQHRRRPAPGMSEEAEGVRDAISRLAWRSAPGTPAPMQVEAAGSAAAAAAPAAEADAMSEGPNLGPPGDVATEPTMLATEATNADLVKLGCNPIELSQLESDLAKVPEVSGRGRFLERAREFGLLPGFALDPGAGWGLNVPVQRDEAMRLLDRGRPLLLIGSPRCTAWTSLLDFGSVKEETIEGLMAEAIEHVAMCVTMYNKQLDEAPHSARSGHASGIQDLIVRKVVFHVANDQCEAGQTVPVKQPDGSMKDAIVQGRTGWLTYSLCIAKELAHFQSRNRHGGYREHYHLLDGEAKHKANYPPALVAAILRGFEAQVELDKMASGMGISVGSLGEGYNVDAETREMLRIPEYVNICDDVTGVQLPPGKVADAREAEVEFLHGILVYKHVGASEADGREIIGARSRVCAKEVKWGNPWLEGTFAGTPPWGGTKMVLSKAMAKAKNPNGCFKKKKKLALAGYGVGVSCPCAFTNSDGSSSGVVRGDDFVFEGEEWQLDAMGAELRKHMLAQRKALLGPDPSDDARATILNRLMSYVGGDIAAGSRIAMEPDPRHARVLVHELGLGGAGSRAATAPTEKGASYCDETPLQGDEETKAYRSLCMRLGFLAQDAPRRWCVASEFCNRMAGPATGGLARLKRVLRFLRGEPRCAQNFVERRHECKRVDLYCDSDWAGDPIDRKSVSSVLVFFGSHLLKSTVGAQGATALSRGEAGFTAAVEGASVALGVRSLGADLGMMLHPVMRADSGAAKGIVGRRGVGRIRHLHTPLLWVLEKRISGPRDSRVDVEKRLKISGFAFESGEHPGALAAQIPVPGQIGGLSGCDRDR